MRDALHHELKTEFHALFETKMAYKFSAHPEYFNSVKKISSAILKLMAQNQAQLIAALNVSEHIQKELLSPALHGHLSLDENVSPTGETIFSLFLKILSNEKSNLAQVLLIHGFFIYRLYDFCDADQTQKASLKTQITQHGFFVGRSRSKAHNSRDNKNAGTIKNPALARLANLPTPTHGSPKDHFNVGEESAFVQQVKAHDLPIASNISGHTSSMLLGAMLYGSLTTPELQEYLIAAFSYMTVARAHTFHEVTAVGASVGLPFSFDDYKTAMPDSIRQTKSYQQLSMMFPQYLSEGNTSNSDLTLSI